MVLPNFIGVGSQKCGTTFLCEYLRLHPDVFMSSPKELKTFNNEVTKEILLEYSKKFNNHNNRKIRGEFSSDYIYSDLALRQISKYLENPKILCVIREPVSRTLSHYKHLIRDGLLKNEGDCITLDLFKEAYNNHPQLINNSLYFQNLKNCLNIFGKENFIFFTNEDLTLKQDVVLESVCQFLAIDYYQLKTDLSGVGVGVTPRFQLLEDLRRFSFKVIRKTTPTLLNHIRRSFFLKIYKKINSKNDIYFSNDTVDFIMSIVSDDWDNTIKLYESNHA